MAPHHNAFGQPVGDAVPGWLPRAAPPRTPIEGRTCRLEPMGVAHARDLFEANTVAADGRNFTYLSVEPFASFDAWRAWVEKFSATEDPVFYTVIDAKSGKASGIASLMRIDRANGVIEVGHINFSNRLQRTTAATEAIFLLMRRCFDELGYRRFEWKCDSLNAPSRAAAQRFGFRYEGIFRQAIVYKGRSRDTAWFAIIDKDWPALKRAYEAWLAPANFDEAGRQREGLAAMIARVASTSNANSSSLIT